MTRFLATLLLVLLPLQWAAAAVTPYCVHAATVEAQQNVDHHDHARHAQAGTTERDNTHAGHADCTACVAPFAFSGADMGDTMLPRGPATFDVRYSAPVTDSVPDNLFRPPALFLA